MALILKAEKAGADRPIGIQQAVLSNIIDLGKRPDTFNPGKEKHQIILLWQLAEKYKNKEGKELPFMQSRILTASLNEKATLRKLIDGMVGKSISDGTSIDIERLIGHNCMLNLVMDDKGFAKVESAAPLMKNLTKITVMDIPIPQWILDMKNGVNTTDPSTANVDDVLTKMFEKTPPVEEKSTDAFINAL